MTFGTPPTMASVSGLKTTGRGAFAEIVASTRVMPADVAGASGPLPQLRLHRDEEPKSTAAVEFEGTPKQLLSDRGAPASLRIVSI